MDFKKEGTNLFFTIVASFLSAIGLWIFVYPANFAPSGVDGIATMLQSITKINAGIFSIALNLPLLITAWFFLKRRYVIYTMIFTVISSGLLMLFEFVGFYQYQTVNSGILSAIFSGVILGVRTGIMLKLGASSGGIDIIAGVIQKKKPHIYIERSISIICYVIIGVSIFVYKDLECILMSIIQMFVFEKASAVVLSDTRNAIEVKIITDNPQEVKHMLLNELKHGATIVEAKGGFTEDRKTIIYSVINKRQIPEFMQNIRVFKNTFVYYSVINGVYGNFRWRKDDEVK